MVIYQNGEYLVDIREVGGFNIREYFVNIREVGGFNIRKKGLLYIGGCSMLVQTRTCLSRIARTLGNTPPE